MPQFSHIDPIFTLLSPAKQPGATLEDALLYYLDHPVEWIEDTIGVQLYAWQQEVLNALTTNHFISVRSGHGVGKSAMLANAALWFLCTHPFSKVICTAPTREQLFDVLWAEFAQWIRRSSKLTEMLDWGKDRISMKSNPEEWFIAARTAEVRKMGKDGFSVAEGLQGRHAESILFILDEASGIDEAIVSTVYGALTTADAYVIMAGNPTRPNGTFFESHHSKRHIWKSFHVSCEGSPNVDQRWVREMLEIYGYRDHPFYRIRVRGEFPTASQNAVFPLDLVEAAQKYTAKANKFDPIEIGVDIARYGGDFTAIVVRQGPEIVHISKYPHLSTMESAGRVIRFINEYQPAVVRIDTIGVGGGVYDRLRELGYKQCISFMGSSSPSDKRKKEFANLRAESHWYVRELLEQGKLKLPEHEELAAQMSAITFTVQSNGKIKIDSKEEIRDRSLDKGRSPDLLDALVMACYPSMPIVRRANFANFASILGR